jgi:predicted transcriptional regulator
MTPAELVRTTRERKRLSQRRLALRAGTSQSAVARIERGDEEVTWPRLRSLMLAMGEEPVLSSRPVASRYDAADLLRDRMMSPESRLANGITFNEFATEMALAGRRAKDAGGSS